MKLFSRIFEWFYIFSLNLYPVEFYTEFGDEMMVVFEATMLEAENAGWSRMLRLFGHEIRVCPAQFGGNTGSR